MKSNIEIVLNYDFDPEQGYTQKSIIFSTDEMIVFEDVLKHKKKLIVNLYEEDLRELVKGTGIELDEE